MTFSFFFDWPLLMVHLAFVVVVIKSYGLCDQIKNKNKLRRQCQRYNLERKNIITERKNI